MMRCIGISDQSDKFEYVMQLPLQVLPLLAADFDNYMVSGAIRNRDLAVA